VRFQRNLLVIEKKENRKREAGFTDTKLEVLCVSVSQATKGDRKSKEIKLIPKEGKIVKEMTRISPDSIHGQVHPFSRYELPVEWKEDLISPSLIGEEEVGEG